VTVLPKTVVVLGRRRSLTAPTPRAARRTESGDPVDRSFRESWAVPSVGIRGWRSAKEVLVHPSQDALPGIEMMTPKLK